MPNKYQDIANDYVQAYSDAYQGWSHFLTQAEDNMKVFLGDQLSAEEKAWLKEQNRLSYVFNKVARFMLLISGYEIRDRHILKIGPVGFEDDQACSQHTGIIMNSMDSAGGYDIMSDAFLYGSLVSGANLVEIYPHRRTGDIQYARIAHNEFLLCPNFTKPDLSDCDFICRGKWINDDQVHKLLPFLKGELSGMASSSPGVRWNTLPAARKMYGKQMRLYEEFWRRETRKQKMVVARDENMRPIGIFKYEDYIQRGINAGYDKRQIVEFLRDSSSMSTYNDMVDTVKLSVLVDGNVVWDGYNPTGLDDYNFVFISGLFVPEYDDDQYKLQGLMMRAKDPQKATNRRICQIMDIIERRIQEAIVAKEGSIKNWKSIYKSGQGLRLWVKKEMPDPVNTYIYQLPVSDIQPGTFQFYDLLGKEAIEILGLNTDILGADDKDIPAILHKYRTGAALIGLQPIFKGYRQAKIQLGRLHVKFIQRNYKPWKVQRIINENPAQGFYDDDMTKYDCNPTEGLLTDSQRHLAYSELRQLKADFPDLGITGDILLKLLPIQLPNKIMQLIAQNQQQQAMLQRQQQEALERQERLQEAVTASEVAQAQERMTQSAENRGNLALDRVKAMAEIAKLRGEPLFEYLDRVIALEKINADRQKMVPSGRQ